MMINKVNKIKKMIFLKVKIHRNYTFLKTLNQNNKFKKIVKKKINNKMMKNKIKDQIQ